MEMRVRMGFAMRIQGILLEGAWFAAEEVEYMNCSVRSLDSFMFYRTTIRISRRQ